MTPPTDTSTFIPFLDPIDLHAHWIWLLPPLIFVICLVHKTLKLPHLRNLLAESVRLSVYILAVLILAATALYMLNESV